MGPGFISGVRSLIRTFVNEIPLGPDNVQVGIAMFSSNPALLMDLNTYANKDSLTSALSTIKRTPRPTINIGKALDFVRENMLDPDKGSRILQRVPQVVMLFTSKASTDSVEKPVKDLKDMGVLTMAVGFKSADERELQKIAVSDEVVFMNKGMQLQPKIVEQITNTLSTFAGRFVEEPTEKGAN